MNTMESYKQIFRTAIDLFKLCTKKSKLESIELLNRQLPTYKFNSFFEFDIIHAVYQELLINQPKGPEDYKKYADILSELFLFVNEFYPKVIDPSTPDSVWETLTGKIPDKANNFASNLYVCVVLEFERLYFDTKKSAA